MYYNFGMLHENLSFALQLVLMNVVLDGAASMRPNYKYCLFTLPLHCP